jgi:integrase/recombinase XerD
MASMADAQNGQPAEDTGLVAEEVRDLPEPRRKRKLPKTLAREEVRALLDVCNLRAPTGLRDHCMMLLMYEAGLRLGEVRHLAPRDVDTARGEVRIYDGKGGDGTAYFDPEGPVAGRIEEWRRVRRRLKVGRSAPLFCTVRKPAGMCIEERSVQQMVKRRALRAGLDPSKVTPHRLRHTFATELLDEGKCTIYDVQQLLRHADLSSTEVYLHVRDAHLREKMRGRPR